MSLPKSPISLGVDGSTPQVERTAASSESRAAAFEFGWQCYLRCLQGDRTGATAAAPFESIEAELERQWVAHQTSKQEHAPWHEAREAARDAWNQVQDALLDGSQAKASAR